MLLDAAVNRIAGLFDREDAPKTTTGRTPLNRDEMTLSDPFPMSDPDERAWVVLGSGPDVDPYRSKTLVETDRILLRNKSRRSTRHNPHGRAILRNLVKYTLGRGVKPRWGRQIDNEKKRREDLDSFWRDLAFAWKWRQLSTEVLVRLARDGEVFLRRFAKEITVPLGGPGRPKKRIIISPRFVDPELIRDPKTQSEEQGIVTKDDDVETVTGYKKVKQRLMSELDLVLKPEDVIYQKTETDMNERRGITMFASVLSFIEQYDTWMQDRMVLSKVRSSVAMVRTFDGTATQIKARLGAENDFDRTQLAMRGEVRPIPNMAVNQKRYRPGTVINAAKGVDYKFISPNLQAADVHHDGRAILLILAAGTGLAEFMVSADSSSSNYASTLIAEGPAVKEFQLWQEIVSEVYTNLWIWAVEMARAHGDERVPDDYDPRTITWAFPDMVARMRVHEVQANIASMEAGIMSRRTAMERDGTDYDIEQARLVDEATDIEAILKARKAKLGIAALNTLALMTGTGGGSGGKPGQARLGQNSKLDAPDPNSDIGNAPAADVNGTE